MNLINCSGCGNETDNIAYIYLCHNNPELLGRVANALKYGDDAIFVHVDNKVDIDPFIASANVHTNVHFNLNRIDNYWGGFNSIIATMETIRLALNYGKYSRFVLLQGQDYPLFSPKEIHNFFLNNELEYCQAEDITMSIDKKDYMKWAGYWFTDFKSKSFVAKAICVAVSRFNRLGIKYRTGIFKYNGKKWHVYKGWAQFALTEACVKYVLDTYDNNKKFNRFIKHRFPPDEIYIHTIIHNSKYKEKLSKNLIRRRNGELTTLNLTYFEYPVSVTVFTERTDYEWLKKTGCLFVRKVNSSSKELLDEIDANITEK